MLLLAVPAVAQNVNVNPGAGSYPTLKAAFDNINNGTHTGAIIIDIVANITEASSAVLNASGAGMASYSSILIQPSGGAAITVSGNLVNGHLIDLNGAQNVTIDGLNTGGNSLAIVNTGTGLSSTIRFIADAKTNIIQHCTLRGSGTNISSGVVFFSSGASSGNDGNNINNCNITAAGTNLPTNGIYSNGTSVTVDNSGNTIHQNSISDYFNAGSVSIGINISSTGNSTWTITNNRLYQTANRIISVNDIMLSGILIGTGSGYVITGNIIGYANASGTGTTNLLGISSGSLGGIFPSAYTLGSASLNTLRYIALNCTFTAGGTVSEIQNNTISGFAMITSSGAAANTGIWCGINVNNGNANIGTTSGNTIGATSGNGAIYSACFSAGGAIVGIYVNSGNTVNIQNNSFGAFDAMGTSNTISGAITGIDVTGPGGIFSIANNTIGNTSAKNIRTGNLVTGTDLSNIGTTFQSTTGTASPMVGIRSAATGNTLNISGNTLQGWATSCTAGATLTGIGSSGTMTGATPSVTVNGNFLGTTARDWMTYTVANSGALTGVSVANFAATTYSIQTNAFRGITYNVAGSGVHTYIILTNATAANAIATIASNTFTSLNVNTTGAVTFISHTYNIAPTGQLIINNNSIVTGFTKPAASGNLILTTTNGTSLAGSVNNYTNNNFSNITVSGISTIIGFNNTDGAPGSTKTITGNSFNGWTSGTGLINAMNFSYWNGASSLSNNTISNITGQAAVTGITMAVTGSNATSISVASNNINNLISTGTGGNVTGISCANTSPGINFNNNNIHSLSSTGASSTVNGISITGTSSPTITKNKIFDLSGSQAGSIINGINAANGTLTISNNLIGDLRAPASTGLNAINGINLNGTGTYNVYYNTIYLNATSSSVTTFGNSCITFSSAATSFNNRNNILVNLSTPAQNGANVASNGFVACLRRTSGTNGTVPANYAITSNNNLYWVYPTAGTNNHLTYGEGISPTITNPMNTLALFMTFLVNRDQLSVTENPTFLSTTGSSASFLHIDPTVATQINDGAASIGGITDDYDGDVRNVTTPDIGADEMSQAGCSGAVGGNATVTGPSSFCGFGIPDIHNTGYSEGAGSAYQWMSSAGVDAYPSGGTPVSMQNNPAALVTGTVTTTTYFWLKVTCTSGIATAYSNMVTININPAPTATISPSGIVYVCMPTTSQLLTSSTDASSPSYVWKKDGVIMNGAIESTCAVTENGSYTVEITDGVTMCMAIAVATLVEFDGFPDAGVVSGTTPLCVGASETYTSSGNPGGTWSSSNPSVASVNAMTGVVMALAPGTTDIKYTDSNLCGEADIDQIALTVDPIEVANSNDAGEGSLRDIIDCAGSGATITFSADMSGTTILLTSGEIVINKNLTLAGPGALLLSLSGNNASRLFHVLPGNTLTIQGMNLKDATSPTNGGAVYAQGNLTLNGVTLQHNFENGTEKSLTVVGPAFLQIIGTVDFKQ